MYKEDFERQNFADRNSEDIFSKPVRAGKRTYFFDVKTTKGNNDYYLTITESKRRQEDRNTFLCGEHLLAALRLILDPYHRIRILRWIDTGFPVEFPDHPFTDLFIKIFSSKLIVSAAGFYLQHTIKHFQQSNIKGTSSQIIDQDMAFFIHMIQTIA